MDALSPWAAHIVDLRTLFSVWERHRVEGRSWTTRFREIHSACMFTLCLENGTPQRYLIGFPVRGTPKSPVTANRLFDGNLGEIEDCDLLLVNDPKCYGESQVLHHRCQLTSYMRQRSTSEADFVAFLERKKLKVAPDDDLRLVVHIEQSGYINYSFLWTYLTHRSPACPYSQVFVFGQTGNAPRKWSCALVYPDLAVLPDLDERTAKQLLLDREQYCRRVDSN